MFKAYLQPAYLAMFMALGAAAHAQQADIWMKLDDGKDLNGWQGKVGTDWKVDTAGVIVGTHPSTSAPMNGENTFLFTDSLFNDFHLKLEGRMPGSGGYRNSGIMYRSTIVNKTGYAAMGYQYEFSDGGTGAFYHERGSELGFTGGCKDVGAVTDWKTMEIIADGPKVSHLMGGKSCFEYSTFKVTSKGLIALQLHAPGDFTVNFRNIFIQPLNNSFQIPADNAWDGTGKKISVAGIRIRAKAKPANLALGLPNSVLGYDARGRLLLRTMENGGHRAYGLMLRSETQAE